MTEIKSEGFFICRKGSPEKAFERRAFTLSALTEKDVLIEVEAFGLNYADVMARNGMYKDAPSFPCIVGYEVVGRIVEVGSSVDQSLCGARVAAFCRFGGYAKHVITKDNAFVLVGDEPAAELLGMCTQGVTAYYMSEYLTPIQRNETVLIHAAAGGVGSILIQLAKLKGAIVIAKVGSKEKLEFVKELGADYQINYNETDYIEQIRSNYPGGKIDLSFNPFGGSTYKKDMSIMNSGGRTVLFGGSELSNTKWGILSQLNFVRKMGLIIPVGLMMNSKSVLGVNMLKIADNKPNVLQFCLSEIFNLYKEGLVKTQVGGLFSSEQLNEAHLFLESGKSMGKIVVKW